jgi:hypothetical protein
MIVCLRRLFFIAFALSCFLQQLQAQDVKAEYNKEEDFSHFRSYSWVTNESYARPLLAMDIRGAIDEQLKAKGLTEAATGADLIVVAYGALDTDMSVSFSPSTYVMPGLEGPVWWTTGAVILPGNSTAVFIKKGTLVVDIADPHSKQLKWRGIGKDDFDPKKQRQSLDRLHKLIAKMFQNYPSR